MNLKIGIDCAGQCLRAVHHNGVCSCVCKGVNHAAFVVAKEAGIDFKEVLGQCHGKPLLAEDRTPCVLPPNPFGVGQRVRMSEAGMYHIGFWRNDDKGRNYLSANKPFTGFVYGGSYGAGGTYPYTPYLRVIKEGTGTPQTYHPSFWEAA